MRKRILGAAFKLFVEKGYAGTSTLEVATRAKVDDQLMVENSSRTSSAQ